MLKENIVTRAVDGASMPKAASDDDVVFRKVAWRIIPFLFLAYFTHWLDRTNVGIAALQMNQDLGFSPSTYAIGAAIFFAPYALLEIPSNMLMALMGARIWLGRIMITWGLVSAAMAFVVGPNSFYLVRFLLGVAEAGYVPAAFLYMTFWFPRRYMARAQAFMLIASPFSAVLGSPMSGLLLELDGVMGLRGWQWLFAVEAIPALILGIYALIALKNSPQEAAWLTAAEKDRLVTELREEDAQRAQGHKAGLRENFSDIRLLMIGLVNFLWDIGFYGFVFWTPQIIKAFGGLSNLEVSLLNALPALFGLVALILWARHSDRSGERGWHSAIPQFLTAAGLLVSGFAGSPVVSMIALVAAGVGIYAFIGVFYTMAPDYLKAANAASGIALVTTLGNVAGFIGPYAVGMMREAFGDFRYALFGCAACFVAGGLIAIIVVMQPKQASPA